MRARRLIAASVVVAAASLVSCTFLVSFDTRSDAGCADGACPGNGDATLGDDGVSTGDDAFLSSDDGGGSADVGDCTVLSEGEACAKPDVCRMPSTL